MLAAASTPERCSTQRLCSLFHSFPGPGRGNQSRELEERAAGRRRLSFFHFSAHTESTLTLSLRSTLQRQQSGHTVDSQASSRIPSRAVPRHQHAASQEESFEVIHRVSKKYMPSKTSRVAKCESMEGEGGGCSIVGRRLKGEKRTEIFTHLSANLQID